MYALSHVLIVKIHRFHICAPYTRFEKLSFSRYNDYKKSILIPRTMTLRGNNAKRPNQMPLET